MSSSGDAGLDDLILALDVARTALATAERERDQLDAALDEGRATFSELTAANARLRHLRDATRRAETALEAAQRALPSA